jgi:chromosome partitioning protein
MMKVPQNMKAIISVANVAAGVGKTTISVNLAVELAARGYQTLFIDADPQAHATRFSMTNKLIMWTLADTLCPPRPGARHNFARWHVFSPSRFDNLFVVPSGICLATFEGMEDSHVSNLKSRLATIERSYELIVIDTPSSLALLTQACLHASTHVLVPILLGVMAKRGGGCSPNPSTTCLVARATLSSVFCATAFTVRALSPEAAMRN